MPLALEGVFSNIVGDVGLLALLSTNYLKSRSFISPRREEQMNHTHTIYISTLLIYRFM